MISTISLRWALTLTILFIVMTGLFGTVRAASGQSCARLTSPQGYSVYDANHNASADRDGDVWAVSTNTDEHSVLIKFTTMSQRKTAYLYAGGVNPLELCTTLNPYWKIRIMAEGGDWYLPNGQPNWNLNLTLHSFFNFQDNEYEIVLANDASQMPAEWPANAIKNVVDIETHDLNGDGVPENEIDSVDVAGPYPIISVNMSKTWRPTAGDILPAVDSMIMLSADKSRIARIKHLIPIRHLENAYSFVFGKPAGGAQASFAVENPFAFYDLQGDSDGESELKLRAITEDQDRRYDNVTAYNEFRYSWAQDGNLQRYRVYVVGDPLISEVHTYGKIKVSHLDYSKLPSFVFNQMWLGAAFAEYESTIPRAFPEGIYESLVYTPQVRSKLLDRAKITLAPYLPPYTWMREEYNFDDFNRTPRLYFSAVDRRLHMIGAKTGVIVLDAKTSDSGNGFEFTSDELTNGTATIYKQVLYADTDIDGYFDTWTYQQQNKADTQLIIRPDLAMLMADNNLYLKQLPQLFVARLWEMNPPTNTQEWRTLEDHLKKDEVKRHTPDDLTGMFNDLPGTVTKLEDASVLQLSSQPEQLIALIQTRNPILLNGGQIKGNPYALPAGQYVILNDHGKLSVSQPEMPIIEISPIAITRVENTNTPLYGYVEFMVRNTGSLDASPVELVVQQERGIFYVTLLDKMITLPARGQQQFRIPWYPDTGEKFTLSASVRYAPAKASGQATSTPKHQKPMPIVAQQTTEFQVQLPASASPLFLSNTHQILVFVLFGLLALTVIIVTVIFAYENEKYYVNSD